MATHHPAGPSPPGSWDEALARLEDFLLAYPAGRALPGLGALLRAAGVSEEFLRSDERALKVLQEAVAGRPLGSMDAVARVRTEVELLTVEVRVLAERLAHEASDPDEAHRVSARLHSVRDRLDGIRRLL